ncbi:MAG: hypothetical protein CVV25_01535 [Ignavibacteriae bacterium HGW-Ignavibacteriae-4]|jgi:hypothetical protein|nr:MAG: hypothetical protein CVV25_01535 [Ignavibacteriae bacterium HGW-Ignavibacteriae-4]
MKHENLINEYFDGNLDSTNQELLFNELASSEELRYDFNQLFAMKMAIGKDTAAFVPAISSTEALFANLGIAGTTSSNSLAGFWTLYKAPILTGLMATMATALVMLWLLPIGSGSNNSEKSRIPVVSSYSYDTADLTLELPEEKNNESNGALIQNRELNKTKELNKIVSVNARLNSQLNNLQNQIASLNSITNMLREENKALELSTNQQTNSELNINKKTMGDNPNTVFQSNFVEQPNSFSSNNANFIINNFNTYNPETSIKLEAALGRYFQNIGSDFVERNNTFSDNLRVSGLYNLSREYSIGLDLRQENFYQEFTDISNSGQKLIYQQQPTVYSASMIFRYAPEYLEFLQVRPNIDLSVGATNIGELARIGVGLDYYLFGNTYFYFKSDYTFLSYYHKNINFSSNKYGTHLGIGVEF